MVLHKCWGSLRLCYVTMVVQFVYGWGSEGSAGKNTWLRRMVGDGEGRWEVSQVIVADDTVLEVGWKGWWRSSVRFVGELY